MAEIEGTAAKNMPKGRISAEEAGYMELAGAMKDGDCEKVRVPGGVSFERGCCNLFEGESEDTTAFSCGTCEYKKPNGPAAIS